MCRVGRVLVGGGWECEFIIVGGRQVDEQVFAVSEAGEPDASRAAGTAGTVPLAVPEPIAEPAEPLSGGLATEGDPPRPEPPVLPRRNGRSNACAK